MPVNSLALRTSALFCFVLADGVSAYPRQSNAIDEVRLIGDSDVQYHDDAYLTGKRLLAGDDVVGALAAFQRALATAPKSVDALNGIGVSYDRLGRADIARSFYEAGLEIDPASPSLLNNLGYSLFLNGDYAAAIIPLRAAAASSDGAAAEAAKATLKLLIAQVSATPTIADPKETKLAARIELTSDGEQRLIFGTSAGANEVASSLGDDASAVLVAAAWTEHDDSLLLTHLRDDQQAKEIAMAVASRIPENNAVTPAAVDSPIQMAALPARSPPAAEDLERVVVTARPRSALVLGEVRADATFVRRRVGASQVNAVALANDGPRRQPAVVFESDDAELNAFAARVRVDLAVAAVPSGGLGSIVARFRA